MGVDRRKVSGTAQSRPDARSQRFEKPSGSLADRIGGHTSQSRNQQGQQTPRTNTQKSQNNDNPLYAYLNGQKPAKPRIISPYQRPSDKLIRSESAPGRFTHTKSDADVSIKGAGAASNAFSIRGASSTSVSIKNLAPGTNQADVCTILNAQIGEVEDCVTFPVSGGLSTTAEVKFGSRIAADKAIKLLHGVLADNKRLNVTILLESGNVAPTVPGSKQSATRAPASQDTEMVDVKPQRQNKQGSDRNQESNGRQQPNDLFANRLKGNSRQNGSNRASVPRQHKAGSVRY